MLFCGFLVVSKTKNIPFPPIMSRRGRRSGGAKSDKSEEGESVRPLPPEQFALSYITDTFTSGPFADPDQAWESVFAGMADPITGDAFDGICPATSVFGACVDHVMLRRGGLPTGVELLVKHRRILPMFAKKPRPSGQDPEANSKQFGWSNVEMTGSDHHGLSFHLVVLHNGKPFGKPLKVVTLNVYCNTSLALGELGKFFNHSNECDHAEDARPDVIFFQEDTGHGADPADELISAFGNRENVFGYVDKARRVSGPHRFSSATGLNRDVTAILRKSNPTVRYLDWLRFPDAHDKGAIRVVWRPAGWGPGDQHPVNEELNELELVIAGTHLFGGSGSDEAAGFRPGVRPEEVRSIVEDSLEVDEEDDDAERHTTQQHDHEALEHGADGRTLKKNRICAVVCGDFNSQRPEDVAAVSDRESAGDTGVSAIRLARRDSFLGYARRQNKF